MFRIALISICLICSASSDPGDHIHNEISIEVRGDYRYIESNGIPEHSTGQFPNRGNPNKIEPQKHSYRITLQPKANKSPTPVVRSSFGVAVNGVFFEPSTAEYWRRDRNSGWRMEAIRPKGPTLGLDMNNAHVQRGGLYHYHAVPTGLIVELQGEESESPKNPVMIGWAADGYPIYGPLGYSDTNDSESSLKLLRPSWQLKKGTRQTEPEGPGGRYDGTYEQDYEFIEGSGDLDRFNGRSGVTPEQPDGTYYYVTTNSFPFISRSWKGTPDPSFSKGEHRRGTRGSGPTGEEPSDVAVTPNDTKPAEGSFASNSAKKSYIQSRSGQVLFEIDGNRIRSRMGQIMYEIDGNRIRARSGQTVCTIDGYRIRSRMGQIMYEIDGNRIKARSGQTVCTIDGNRIRSRMGQTIFTMKGGVPLKTIALLIGAGALNLDQ